MSKHTSTGMEKSLCKSSAAAKVIEQIISNEWTSVLWFPLKPILAKVAWPKDWKAYPCCPKRATPPLSHLPRPSAAVGWLMSVILIQLSI